MASTTRNSSRLAERVLRWSLIVVIGLAIPTASVAAPQPKGWSVSPASAVVHIGSDGNVLRLVTGKSLVIKMANAVKRVSVADPETADVLLVNSHQVMVNALEAGESSVIVWDNKGRFQMYDIIISDSIQEQIVLEVTVAEVNRTQAERHGFDFRTMGGQFGAVTQYGNVSQVFGSHPPTSTTAPFPVSLAGEISWAVVDFKNDIAAFVRMVEDADFAHILAEPKLLARSGEEAQFLSGGEIPIIINENDQTSVEFKEFGTKLEFTPVVEPDGNIRLKLFAEVSEPDFANGVILNNFAVPGFVTRRAETDVRLQDQQSLVIAGLLKEQDTDFESKNPVLGDIPVLGYLFRSKEKTTERLEIVIVVQPKMVRSGNAHAKNANVEKKTSNNSGSLDYIKKRIHGNAG